MQLNPVRPDQLRSGAVSKAITRFISQGRRDFVPRGLGVVDRGGRFSPPDWFSVGVGAQQTQLNKRGNQSKYKIY